MKSKLLIYNVVSNFAFQIILILYGLIVPRLIIGSYGSEVNGLIISISQFLGYITLLEAGFGPVIKAVLYKPIAKKDNEEIKGILKASQKIFRKIAIIFILYIIGLLIFYPTIINGSFNYLYTASLISIIAISTFAEYFIGMTYTLFIQAKQKNYVISSIQIITYVICIICVTILIKLNVSVHIVKLVTALLFAVRPIIQKIYVEKKLKIVIDDNIKEVEIKNKWDGLAQHIASVIHNNTDVAILTLFCNLKEVSVYSVYLMVVNGIKGLMYSFSSGIDAMFGITMEEDTNEVLNTRFKVYETVYYTITAIIFTSTMLLIVPFIQVYTKGVTDVNYVRYLFGYLIVIAEYMWAIRLPYNSITLAAGHFKQTKKGAWIEAIINIVISLLLVKKYGMLGVIIGTIVAMLIRTVEFVYHTNKYILKRKHSVAFIKIIVTVLETVLIVFLVNNFINLSSISYIGWIVNGIKVFAISLITILTINSIIYLKDYKHVINILKVNFLEKNKK